MWQANANLQFHGQFSLYQSQALEILVMSSVKLGENALYADQYNAGLLEPIERRLSRESLFGGPGIPFKGADIWTAYELSWLSPKGCPCVRIAEFSFPADSAAIIESKSFKYYLNSFNQSVFENEDIVDKVLTSDLSTACGASVDVRLFAVDDYRKSETKPQGVCVDQLDVTIDEYQPNSTLLVFSSEVDSSSMQSLYSHLLKSNCPVTGQPDWATVWVQCSGKTLSPDSFLRYVVSYRKHQDFHENCVEKIYCDLMARGELESLAVYARFTRRGGLDINPYRASANFSPCTPSFMALRTSRQ